MESETGQRMNGLRSRVHSGSHPSAAHVYSLVRFQAVALAKLKGGEAR